MKTDWAKGRRGGEGARGAVGWVVVGGGSGRRWWWGARATASPVG